LLDFALFFLGAVELVLVLFVLGFKSTILPFELLDLVLLLIVRIDALYNRLDYHKLALTSLETRLRFSTSYSRP